MQSAKLNRLVVVAYGIICLLLGLVFTFVLYQFRAIELDKARKQTEPARMAKLAKLNGSGIEEIKTEVNEN